MPDYKKKKVSNKLGRKKANIVNDNSFQKDRKKRSVYEDIEMTPSAKKVTNSEVGAIKVVKGKKLERQRKFRAVLTAIAVILVAYIILAFTLPVSVGENIGNLTATFGAGEYPIEIYGTDIVDTSSKGLYYYVLTDTNLSAFSSSGKEIYSYSHGYENPILKTSQTRAMLFTQGGNSLKIYNLSKKLREYNPKKAIITADICRNGTYAVAMYSDSYASSVKVFDNNNKSLFQWNSAKDTVNSVTLSPNGRYLAASTFNANGGSFNAKISVFDIEENSADPKTSFELSGKMVYSLNGAKKGFTIITADGLTFVDWKSFTKKDYKSERQVDMFRASADGIVAVYNLHSNKSDNIISVISPGGEKLSEFNFNGIISDIRFLNGHIYCISEAKVYLYDNKGNLLGTENCGFGAFKLAVTGSQSVAVISDNEIKKIQFKG